MLTRSSQVLVILVRRRIGGLSACAMLIGLASLAACADNLNGPSGCVFAYEVAPGSINVNVADSVAVTATPVANCGGPPTVTWRVEDATKATVRSTGALTAVVRGVAPGTTILNAENGSRAGFTIVQVH
jgi:hypothetical protein